MMVSALSAVIIWRVLGLNEAIFESIPGMGAAFIATFYLLNLGLKKALVRLEDLIFLIRISW